MEAYAFYTGTYKGSSVPEEEWDSFCRDAEAQLARYERMYTVTWPTAESRSMALCAMADALFTYAQLTSGNGPATSVSVGSVSESRQQAGSIDTSAAAQEAELYRCLTLYGEVYRGAGRGCCRCH